MKSIFKRYGEDAVNNKYFDRLLEIEFIVYDYKVERKEKRVYLYCRTTTNKGFKIFNISVNEITECNRFYHVKGSADRVL